MPSVLITGANRGIGLELARQYAKAGWRVYACCRDLSRAERLDLVATTYPNLTRHALDVTDAAQRAALARVLAGAPIDVLINNAGVYGSDAANRFGSTDEAEWLEVFRVNTIAPLKLVEQLLPNLMAGQRRVIANISSKMGSIDDNTSGGSYAYRASKAALNIVTKSLALDLSNTGIIAVVLNPGWVRTDMGGPQGELSTEESAAGLRVVIDDLRPSQSGGFFDVDGSPIPW